VKVQVVYVIQLQCKSGGGNGRIIPRKPQNLHKPWEKDSCYLANQSHPYCPKNLYPAITKRYWHVAQIGQTFSCRTGREKTTWAQVGW